MPELEETSTQMEQLPGEATHPSTPGDESVAADPKPDASPEDEVFDKDRAMALIAKLRGEVKSAKEQAKELADLKAAVAAREGEALSEREKVEARALQAEKEREEARAEARRLKAERAIERSAVKLGLDPDLAATLLRAESLTDEAVSDPTAIESDLKALIEKWPQLGTPRSTTSPTNPRRQAAALTLEDIKNMSREEIAANREAVNAALARGK